jgi:hypothetical protein
MIFILTLVFLSLALFGALIGCVFLGWRYGQRAATTIGYMEGLRGTEAAIFGMLGLLIAFTFYGAASRFDTRRQLVVQETNAIGTAYLRLDLLPSPQRDELKNLFKTYVDSRLDVLSYWQNSSERDQYANVVRNLQSDIWRVALEGLKNEPQKSVLVLPPLNEMFDIFATRMLYPRIHPPLVVYCLLAGIGLLCAAVAGFSMAKHARLNRLHVIGFSLMIAFIFFVIVDMEYPRAGLIRIVGMDQAMRDLRAAIGVKSEF